MSVAEDEIEIENPHERPYPGLRPYQRGERYIFFGRDQQIADLLRRLGPDRPRRFLAVIGASGCGKSSLVRAGMIDALETGLLDSTGSRWRVATMHPRDQPMTQLARALLRDGVLGPDRSLHAVEIASLQATLSRGPLGLIEALTDTGAVRDENILLLVDQFEEVFRFRRDVDRDEADAFVALLLRTASEPDRRIFVVLTMRSDFLGDCALFTGLPEALNDNQFLTPKLSREQRREAIEGPAMVCEGRVDEALVNVLLNDMDTSLDDQLPLMQHALMRLWIDEARKTGEGGEIVLKRKDYHDIGTISGALDRDAERAYTKLLIDDDQRAIAEILFRRLTDRDAGNRGGLRRDTRRMASMADIARVVGRLSLNDPLPDELIERVKKVIEVFRTQDLNFLNPALPETLHPETILDVSHESLIRQWKRLGGEKSASAAKEGWIDKEAKASEMFRRLSQAQTEWADRQRDTGRDVTDTHIGREGLLNRLTLGNALEWRKSLNPSPAWASRYGKGLEEVLSFVQLNEKVRRDEDEAEKHRLELEKKQAEEVAEARRLALVAAEELASTKNESLEKTTYLLKLVSASLVICVVLGTLAFGVAVYAIIIRKQANETQRKYEQSQNDQAILELKAARDLEMFGFQQKTAELKTENESLRMASTSLRYQAQVAMIQHPPRGLLLASELRKISNESESKGFGRISENDDALRLALASIGGRALQGYAGNVTALAIDPQGRWVASGGEDGTIRLWNPNSEFPFANPIVLQDSTEPSAAPQPSEPPLPPLPPSPIGEINFDAHGLWLVSQDRAGIVKLWDLKRDPPSPFVLRENPRWNMGAHLSSGGHWLLVINEVEPEALLYDLNLLDSATKPTHLKIKLNQNNHRPWAFSPDETKLAIARYEVSAVQNPKSDVVTGVASVMVWDISSSKTILDFQKISLPESSGPVNKLDFLPDNQTLSILDTSDMPRRYVLSASSPKMSEFAIAEAGSFWRMIGFTRDGQWVITGDLKAGKARLWNTRNVDPRSLPTELVGFTSAIDPWIQVIPGRWLITKSDSDPSMRIWNLNPSVPGGSPPMILPGSRWADNHARVNAFEVTPDNRWLITGSTTPG